MSRSMNSIEPELGRTSPLSRLKSVVLPAPLGPMIACTVFGCTTISTPSTATLAPNALRRLCVRNTVPSPRNENAPYARTEEEYDQTEERAEGQRPMRPDMAERGRDQHVDRRAE